MWASTAANVQRTGFAHGACRKSHSSSRRKPVPLPKPSMIAPNPAVSGEWTPRQYERETPEIRASPRVGRLACGASDLPVRRARTNARTFPLTTRQSRRQPWQSTATSSAVQTSRIRSSLSLPSRSTRTATETLSTESRLIEDRLGTGSSAGSTTTSLARPRIVVVHGATSVRFRRGIAASRESTTTGRRPTSGNSHHHTSPRAGKVLELMMLRPPPGRTQDRPRRQAP